MNNLGVFVVEKSETIVDPPLSASLAIGGVPEWLGKDGKVVARPTIHLTLSVDHRALDGAEGVRFLNDLRVLIEEAEEMLEQSVR